MSQLLTVLATATENSELLAGPGDGVIPEHEPEVPGPLKELSGTVLGWLTGGGLVLSVVGFLVSLALIAVGQNTDRGQLAAKGKSGVLYSLFSAAGFGIATSMVLAFYAASA